MAKKSMIIKQQRAAEKPKFSSRAYTRCKICGRPHSVLRKYGICRICFRPTRARFLVLKRPAGKQGDKNIKEVNPHDDERSYC